MSTKYYSVEEASELIGAPADTIREWISDGKVSCARRAGDVVLRYHDVQRLMSEYTGKAPVAAEPASPPPSQPSAPPTPPAAAVSQRPERLAVTPRHSREASGGYEAVAPAQTPSTEYRFNYGAQPSANDNKPAFLPVPGGKSAVRRSSSSLPAAMEFVVFYDENEQNSVETQRRRELMEKPLPSKAQPPHGRAYAGTERRRSFGRRSEDALASQSTSGVASQQVDQIIEKAIDPIARAQARLIKLFNEVRSDVGADKAASPASPPGLIEKTLTRIENRLDGIHTGAVKDTELKAWRATSDSLTASLHDEMIALRQIMEQKLSSSSLTNEERQKLSEENRRLNADLTAAVTKQRELSERLQEAEKAAQEGQKTDRSAISEEFNKLTKEHESLRQEHESLEGRYEKVRSELDSIRSQQSDAGAQNAELEEVLNRFEILRDALDGAHLGPAEFAEKLVTLYGEDKAALEKLNVKYEACEEENSSLHLLIDRLQEENKSFAAKSDADVEKIAELSSLAQELEALQEAYEQLRQSSSGSDEAFAKLQGEHLETAKLLRDNEAELTKTQSRIETLHTEKSQLEEQTVQLKAQLEEKELAAEEQATAYKALQAEMENLQAEHASTLAKQTAQSEKEIALHDELAALKTAHEELQSQLEEAKQQAEAAQEGTSAELAEARQQLEAAQEEVGKQLEQIKELSEQVKTNEESAQEAQAEVVQLQTQLTSAKAQTDELEAMTAEAHRESSALQTALDETQAQLAEAAKKSEENEALRNSLQEELRAKDEKIEKDAQGLRDAEMQLAKNTAELEALRKSAQEQDEQLEQYKQKAEALQQSLNDDRDKLNQEILDRKKLELEIKDNNAKADSERNRLLKRLNTLNAKNQALRAEIDECKDAGTDFEAVHAAEARMQEQIEQLENELASCQDELRTSRSAQEQASSEREVAVNKALEFQEQLKALQYEVSVGGDNSAKNSREMVAAIATLEAEGAEKDRLIQEGHNERATLREELDNSQRALYELQQRFEKERAEWSKILIEQVRGGPEAAHGENSGEDNPAQGRGSSWRLFNRKNRGGGA